MIAIYYKLPIKLSQIFKTIQLHGLRVHKFVIAQKLLQLLALLMKMLQHLPFLVLFLGMGISIQQSVKKEVHTDQVPFKIQKIKYLNFSLIVTQDVEIPSMTLKNLGIGH